MQLVTALPETVLIFLCFFSLPQLCKLHDFINPDQLNELRPAIDFGLKSIKIRETLDGDEHKVKKSSTIEWCLSDLKLKGTRCFGSVEVVFEKRLKLFVTKCKLLDR